MAGVVTINFKVMKNGMADLGMKSPLYLPGPVEPHYGPGRYLTFEGFSVDEHGKQVSRFPTVGVWMFGMIWNGGEVHYAALSSE
jgi:acetamidase/formamidase